MIQLMEHNKETYKRLCDVLENNNKCALVQATGTGKSYIAGKYIEEHAETALILVPTNAISDAWEELLAGTGKEIDIITYQAFAREPRNYLDYDLVIADEMHHLGSDVWGKKFVETYLQSENHKIIGLTATEIRYLDNSRDMAEEIFENIRVDGCDLPAAINTGVLPTFKYVSALYCDESDFDEWKEKAGKIKDIKTQTELKGRLDVCIKNMVSVKQAVNENLTDDYKKIIVFLNNVESKETALEMFRDVFPTANFYNVDYSKQRTANNKQINKFKADSNRAVLFAVDMLNEGIHIKGTDCVIMFRKTVSPQVYLQQLGRGLASGTDKMPVIFDFAGNVENVRLRDSNEYKETSEIEPVIKEINNKLETDKKIIIQYYAKEICEILREISCLFYNSWTEWEDNYLKEYYGKILVSEIQKTVKRSKNSIITRACFLGITRNATPWTKEEESFVEEHARKMNILEIASYLGRTKDSVANKMKRMNLIVPEKRSFFTEEEFLKNNYSKMSINELAEKTGKSRKTILEWGKKLGLTNPPKKFSTYEDNFIKENWKTFSTREIAKKLNRSESSVYWRAKYLGLLKKS